MDRFERQRDLVPTERLREIEATVIGVGAIGRQVAIQLASLGVRRLRLIDFDMVELSNVTTQGYFHSDVGLPKVVATERLVRQIDPDVAVATIQDRFRSKHAGLGATFCCVDSISAREAIWRAVGDQCCFWADGRMLGDVIRVLAVADGATRERYGTTLFPQAEAQTGRCTARGTIYTAGLAAGLMLNQFVRHLRSLPLDADVLVDLRAMLLTAG